jgi:hypothetical protein
LQCSLMSITKIVDVAGMLIFRGQGAISWQAYLRIQLSNTVIMGPWWRTALQLCKRRDQNLCMVHWRILLVGSSNIISNIIAHTESKYSDYALILMHSPGIIKFAKFNIIAAQLAQVFRR